MVRIPAGPDRHVQLRCGFLGEDGELHTTATIRPLTMLESLQVDVLMREIPEELRGVVDKETWAPLCRTAVMVRELGTLRPPDITPTLLLSLSEADTIYLANQCKEVSLSAASFRGGSAADSRGDLPSGDADRVV